MSNHELQQTDPVEEDGLVFAIRLRGDGTGEMVGWAAVEAWTVGGPPLWIHLDRANARAQSWLRMQSGLTKPTAEALLTEETRPRVFFGKRGTVAVLRGLNLNTGQRTEDMIAFRIWSEGQRVISLRDVKLQSVRDVLTTLIDLGTGPKTITDLFVGLIARINVRIAPTINAYEEQMDQIEESVSEVDTRTTRKTLAEVRRNAVLVRRYLSPQRAALTELIAEPPEWASEAWRPSLRETSDRVVRFVEALDTVKERALLIKDDIYNDVAESTNRTLYVLAMISAVFLPLSFLTGLLGINIGGMPGVDSENAFWVFCAIMGVLLAAEIAVFKYLKWI